MNDSTRGSLTVRLVLTLECLKLQKQEAVVDNHQSSSSSSEDTVDNYQPSPNYYVTSKLFELVFRRVFRNASVPKFVSTRGGSERGTWGTHFDSDDYRGVRKATDF